MVSFCTTYPGHSSRASTREAAITIVCCGCRFIGTGPSIRSAWSSRARPNGC